MTPLQIVRAFWPSIELRIDYDSSPGWEGKLVIRDPACRRDVAAWIREHEREIMDEMRTEGSVQVAGNRKAPCGNRGQTLCRTTATKKG